MRGFTIVEALVAIAVITSGLLGALVLLTSIQASFSLIRDELIASALAEEGIELVRNIRDTNWIERESWTNGILGSGSCADFDSQTLFLCDTTLRFDTNRGIYTHQPTGEPTVFSRSLSVSAVSPDELRVLATISWQRRATPFSVAVEEHLFNWK